MSARRSNKRAKGTGSYRWIIEKGESFDNIAEMIAQMSGRVIDEKPTEIIGTRDRGTGRILGLKATYGPGQTIVIRLRKDKSYSVSYGLRMTTKVGG